ncbi:CRISPR-associated protein [Clostridium sp. JNZ X4-2]
MIISSNSDFLFGFEGIFSNCNGDPDQENKPRMDYETNTLLVSDARRKRDIRDFLKNKGFSIFIDMIDNKKVDMDKMFGYIRDKWFNDDDKIRRLFREDDEVKKAWDALGYPDKDFKESYKKAVNDKKKELLEFNNIFLTEIVKRELIDIRLFGSAMAVKNVNKTYTGPIQMNWGYSLHPVELVKSNSITSIMNNDNSTFGNKYKIYYALVAHYGTVNKYSAKKTGMTVEDLDIFRKAIVQSIMANKTDSKQGQFPLFYFEVVYKPEFDGYLGDLRRFIKTTYDEKNRPIRSLNDLKVDFGGLSNVIDLLKSRGYVENVVGWINPIADKSNFINVPKFEDVDLLSPIKNVGE